MLLRSKVTPAEKAERLLREAELKNNKIIPKDFIQYKGKIKYFTTLVDCALWSETILKKVDQSLDVFVIGFDLEWPFSFKTGSGKTAVMQLCPSLDECFIFHVSTLKHLPKSLTELLAHDNVRITGVNIKNDVRKLSRDFSGIDVEKVINNCIDASSLANSVLNVQRRWSMEKLVNEFFRMQINKDKKVRCSKWHIIPLTKEQQIYAALDAYASLKLYHHLKNMESEILTKENNTNTNN